MSTEVRVPEISDSITTVKVATWLKHEGDFVTRGEPIAELETDKAMMEVESPASGVLRQIRVAAGSDAVPVDSVLAVIVDEPGQEQASVSRSDAGESPKSSKTA